MKIEIGRFYRDRRGLIWGPLTESPKWRDRLAYGDMNWRMTGRFLVEGTHPADLVEAVEPSAPS